MQQPTLSIGNSFSKLIGFSAAALDAVRISLTYKDLEAEQERKRLFFMMRKARMGNKRAYYYVLKAQLEQLPPEIVCWLDKDRFCTGHLSIVKDTLKALNVHYTVQDNRKKPEPYLTLRWNVKPPTMRYYQEEAFNQCLKQGRGVVEQAVGTGKTLIATYIIKELAVNTLFVVPSAALLTQAHDVFALAFGSNKVQAVSAKDARGTKPLKPIRVVTIQTLASLKKTNELSKILGDLDVLFIDEAHHSGSASFTALLDEFDHIYYRFGLSGTYMRNDSKTLDLWGVSGEKIYEYNAAQATKEGYLVPMEYKVIPLRGTMSRSYHTEYKDNYSSQELLQSVKNLVQSIPNDKQILILVDRKESVGHLLYELFQVSGIHCAYATGDNSKAEIKEAIERFNEKKDRILIGSQVFGEGADLRSTDVLVLARGGKSEINLVQAMGRAVRLAPGKVKAVVYDFAFSNTNYLRKHIQERYAILKRQFALVA